MTGASNQPTQGQAAAAQPQADVQETSDMPGYISVPVAAVRGEAPLDFALNRKGANGEIVQFHSANSPLADADRASLAGEGVEFLYVTNADYDRYHRRAEAGLAALLADPQAGEQRFALAFRVIAQLMQEMLESPRQELCQRAAAVAGQAAEAAGKSEGLLEQWLVARPAATSTADHSVSVCLLGLLLAQASSVPQDQWPPLAAGLLLHDIGKMGLAEPLLQKEGRLPKDEWLSIAEHPIRGANWLNQVARLDSRVVQVALSHHERLDGLGYPKRLGAEGIGPWARMCAVVNAYDRLATSRPYRNALPPREAFAVIKGEAGRRFDPCLVECLAKLLNGQKIKPPAAAGETKPVLLVKSPGSGPLPLESYLPLPPPAITAPVAVAAGPPPPAQKSDRRQHRRYRFPVSCRVRFTRPGAAEESHISFWVRALDISRGGLQFVHDSPIRLGELVSIYLPDGGAGRQVNAMVVRSIRDSRGTYGIGVRFDFGG